MEKTTLENDLDAEMRIVSRRVVYECGLARDHRAGLA
jgi:hypothetical protein